MEVYQIKISLEGIRPEIWRRLLVPASMHMYDFHIAIQFAMGWENAHLHEFIKGRKHYREFFDDDDSWDEKRDVDYEDVMLEDLLYKQNDSIKYCYDFGDNWMHTITLEGMEEIDGPFRSPVCLGGENACPPEDVGGIPGYFNFAAVMKNPKDKEYKEYKEWYGDDYDATYLSLAQVNGELVEVFTNQNHYN